jgi:hypothetical protein
MESEPGPEPEQHEALGVRSVSLESAVSSGTASSTRSTVGSVPSRLPSMRSTAGVPESADPALQAAGCVPSPRLRGNLFEDTVGAAILPLEKQHHFYICHKVSSGRLIAQALHGLLKQEGFSSWLDVDAGFSSTTGQSGPTESNMRDGIRSSANVLLVLSHGVLGSEWCQEELNWALEDGLGVVCVHDPDCRKGHCDHFDFDTEIAAAPKWLRKLVRDQDSISFRTKHHEQEALLKEIVYRGSRSWGRGIVTEVEQHQPSEGVPTRASRSPLLKSDRPGLRAAAAAAGPPQIEAESSPRPSGDGQWLLSPSKQDPETTNFDEIYGNAEGKMKAGELNDAELLFEDLRTRAAENLVCIPERRLENIDQHIAHIKEMKRKEKLRRIESAQQKKEMTREASRKRRKEQPSDGCACCVRSPRSRGGASPASPGPASA